MAIELEDEHEVGERVRAWLRNNGGTLLGGMALGIGLIFGWNWWQDSRVEHRITAATQFDALVRAADEGDLDTAGIMAQSLIDGFADTPYALFGQLRLAELNNQQGAIDAARQALDTASGLKIEDAALGALLGLRIAQLEISMDQPQAALDRLASIDPAFIALTAQLRGDALVKLGLADQAREAYREALTRMDSTEPLRQIVERKLAELGDSQASEA